MSVTFHSPREKVYNKICSFVALYPDFCISAVNLKLSITEIYANRQRLSRPNQNGQPYFLLTYKAAGSIPRLEGLFLDLPQRERERQL